MKRTYRMIGAALAAGVAAAAAAAPVSYTLDPDHTIPRFEILHNGFSNHIGAFIKSSGKSTLDFAAGTGSVEVTIETASFLSGHAFMEKVVKGPEFFDSERFPTMTFRSSRIRFDGGKPSVVEGDLTILGVTRPVTLTFTNFACGQHPRTKKDQCGGNLIGAIKRSDFGMKAYIPAIADDVKLLIQVEAFKD
ncbi:MAG TPA: YceI family protein [Burkholderiales bacterium]|nr:YceI family protein [Burkholderiales bacterium]